MIAHTPAPWLVSKRSPDVVVTSEGNWIADCSASYVLTDAERNANARLIAAAPYAFHLLSRILTAHQTGNNGAVMGEASLSPYFENGIVHLLAQVEGGAA